MKDSSSSHLEDRDTCSRRLSIINKRELSCLNGEDDISAPILDAICADKAAFEKAVNYRT